MTFSTVYMTGGVLNTYKSWMIIGVSTLVVLFAIAGYIKGSKLFNENFHFQLSPGKSCQGGAYMNQGDSPRAKMCRSMMMTPEGQEDINRYKCNKGFIGMPKGTGVHGFNFSPDSNSNWKNERCMNNNQDIEDNGIF
jgi:hypothetical protein